MPKGFRLDKAGVRAIGDDVAKLVDDLGDEVLGNMKVLVPVDSFALKRSLIVDRQGEGGLRINFVGVDLDFSQGDQHPADYVEFVEDGTSRQAPQPFQSPALYQAIKR